MKRFARLLLVTLGFAVGVSDASGSVREGTLTGYIAQLSTCNSSGNC